MANEHLNPIFKDILDGVTKQEPEVIKITVRRWKNTDKYPCPKCGTKLGMPSYTCEKCNVKIKPIMNF